MDRSFASHFVLPTLLAVLVDHPQSAHGPNHTKPKSIWTCPRFSYAFARAIDGKQTQALKLRCLADYGAFQNFVPSPSKSFSFFLLYCHGSWSALPFPLHSNQRSTGEYVKKNMHIIARKPTVSSQVSSTSRRPTWNFSGSNSLHRHFHDSWSARWIRLCARRSLQRT